MNLFHVFSASNSTASKKYYGFFQSAKVWKIYDLWGEVQQIKCEWGFLRPTTWKQME